MSVEVDEKLGLYLAIDRPDQIARSLRRMVSEADRRRLDARLLVTVAEITTSIRGLAAEVPIDPAQLGLDRECVINCDAHRREQFGSARFHESPEWFPAFPDPDGEPSTRPLSRACLSSAVSRWEA